MKLISYILTILISIALPFSICYSQIIRDGETFFGNEWINYDQQYIKITIGEDGIYRLTGDHLVSAGVPIADIDVSEYRIYWLGIEQRLFTSQTSGPLTGDDFILFYGEKNRSQVDRFLFRDPDHQMLNPDYALTTDSSAYFLTWTPGIPTQVRYQSVENDLTNLPAPLPWYLHQEKLVFSKESFKGYITKGVRYSTYGEGEGFGTVSGASHNFSIPADHINSAGTGARLKLRFAGNSTLHNVNLSWNGSPMTDFNFVGINSHGGATLIDTIISLEISELKEQNTFHSTATNPIVIGTLELLYPRNFEFEQQNSVRFQLQNISNGAYLELKNFDHGGQSPQIFDLSDGTLLNGAFEGNLTKVNLPPGSHNRDIIILSDLRILTPTISSVKFEDLRTSNAEYIIISHQELMTGDNLIQQYADYRSSQIGGGYHTKIIEIGQLIDQFAYGVYKHPLSIKNFTNYIKGNWTDPKFIFLIGKGLEYRDTRKQEEAFDYLPVYGIPGSDNLLTSQGESSVPQIATGRLAAKNPEHIAIYLEKIKVMEDLISNAPQTIQDRSWMKKVLHLGAGVGTGQVLELQRKLAGMQKIIETGKFQGDVFSWSTQSQDIIDFNEDETVLDLINSGVILKTYFGHGSVTTTQFNGFEDPQFLSNKDRYSVMLSLGCYTGELFSTEISLGEANIFAKDKGASIYIATSGLGYLSSLDIFGRDWYQSIASENINEPIGLVNKKVIQKYDEVESVAIQTLLQQINLHGDPAFCLSKIEGPDFTIDYSSVKFNPEIINSNQDSFTVSFDLYNLGASSTDTLEISFNHIIPSGQTIALNTKRIISRSHITPLTFNLPLPQEYDLQGLNRLLIDLNYTKEIIEKPDPEAYTNNQLISAQNEPGIRLPIVSNTVDPLSPIKYGIVSNEDIELIASTSDPLAKNQNFILQVDTSEFFNSPSLVSQSINQSGGLIKWKPDLDWQDGEVYYWRVSPDSTDEQGFIWSSSSFTLFPESPPGWYQGHYFQLADGINQGLFINENRQFQYSNSYNEIKIVNEKKNGNDFLEFFYDGQQFASPLGSPLQAAISMIIINPLDGEWFINDGASHGSVFIKDENNLYTYDVSTAEGRQAMIGFLDNVVPDGFYVMMYTHFKDTITSFYPETWAADSLQFAENLFSALERHGAKVIRQMEILGSVPYNFLFVKNGPVLDEDIAYSPLESILSVANVPYLSDNGEFCSTLVGPASKWNSVEWSFDWSDNRDDDEIKISVYGLTNPESEPVLLISPTPENVLDIGSISAIQYPFLKLKIHSTDEVQNTTAQLSNWKILYEGLPDIAINPQLVYSFSADTGNIGDQVLLKFGVENISDYDTDSLTTSYILTDTKNNSHVFSKIYTPIKANSSEVFEYSFDTREFLPGVHLLSININPDRMPQEVSYNNNILLQRFLLEADQINPILDVTFDGIRIMNGDIVSPAPLIKIALKDENKTILLQDSSLIKIELIDPDGNKIQLSPEDPDVAFIPANDAENVATVEVTRNFQKDGIYELLVDAKDASGNPAGKDDLSIQFEVINRTSARHLVPYPNPFTENTQFLYTITGSIPEIFKIQIFTVDGSVVKEIDLTQEEFLKIGNHLTDYRWDGTDQFGDRLANGVYLYRVILKDSSGNKIDHLESSYDSFFEKNMGKVVILR